MHLPTLHGVSGREARFHLLDEVRRVAEGDVALFYSFVEQTDGRLLPTDVTATSDQTAIAEVLAIGAAAGSDQLPDVTGAPLQASRGFLDTRTLFGSWENFIARPFTESVRLHAGLGDQVRLLAYHGARYLGWIGALRRWGAAPFGRAERRRLAPMVGRVTATLAAAEALDTLHLPAGPAFLIATPDGQVVHATETAAGWLARPGFRASLEASVRRLDRGEPGLDSLSLTRADASFSRLEGDGGTRYLVCVRHGGRPARRLLATLSPMQRRIAEFVAAGAQRAEIAAAVGAGPETVRTHLREIYRRLGVTDRLELSRVLAEERP